MTDFTQNERQQQPQLQLEDDVILIEYVNLVDEIKINNTESSYINDVSQLITTGKQTRRFNCEVLCKGVNHDLEADAVMEMISRCTSQNNGEFTHPFYGVFPVLTDGSITRSSHLTDSLYTTTISFTLVEITPLEQEESDLADKIIAFQDANAKYLEENLVVDDKNQRKILNKIQDIYKGYQRILNKVNFYTQAGLNIIRDANTAIKNGFYDSVLKPATIISSTKEVLNMGLQQTPKTLKDATNTFYEAAFENPFAKRPDEAQDEKQFDITEYDELTNDNGELYDPESQDFNETLLDLNNMNICLVLMCESFNKTDVRDYSTMTNLKNLMFFAIDEIYKQYEIMITTYELSKDIMLLDRLRDLKAGISKQYDSINLIKKQVHVIENDCLAVQLMLKLYGNYSEEIYLNFIANNPDLNSVMFFKRGQECLI